MAQDPRVLLQKADKAAQGASGGFSLFGGRGEKWENAADLYTQAANAFRVQKQSKPTPRFPSHIYTQHTTLMLYGKTMKQVKRLKKPRKSNSPNSTSPMTWPTP
jgi:hypothetical protein